VVQKLEASPLLPLEKGVGPQASGIYALYFKGDLVYVGKVSKDMTKSKRTLRGRLSEHIGKISGRANISLADMQCRYLTFASEWWVFAAEFASIYFCSLRAVYYRRGEWRRDENRRTRMNKQRREQFTKLHS